MNHDPSVNISRLHLIINQVEMKNISINSAGNSIHLIIQDIINNLGFYYFDDQVLDFIFNGVLLKLLKLINSFPELQKCLLANAIYTLTFNICIFGEKTLLEGKTTCIDSIYYMINQDFGPSDWKNQFTSLFGQILSSSTYNKLNYTKIIDSNYQSYLISLLCHNNIIILLSNVLKDVDSFDSKTCKNIIEIFRHVSYYITEEYSDHVANNIYVDYNPSEDYRFNSKNSLYMTRVIANFALSEESQKRCYSLYLDTILFHMMNDYNMAMNEISLIIKRNDINETILDFFKLNIEINIALIQPQYQSLVKAILDILLKYQKIKPDQILNLIKSNFQLILICWDLVFEHINSEFVSNVIKSVTPGYELADFVLKIVSSFNFDLFENPVEIIHSIIPYLNDELLITYFLNFIGNPKLAPIIIESFKNLPDLDIHLLLEICNLIATTKPQPRSFKDQSLPNQLLFKLDSIDILHYFSMFIFLDISDLEAFIEFAPSSPLLYKMLLKYYGNDIIVIGDNILRAESKSQDYNSLLMKLYEHTNNRIYFWKAFSIDPDQYNQIAQEMINQNAGEIKQEFIKILKYQSFKNQFAVSILNLDLTKFDKTIIDDPILLYLRNSELPSNIESTIDQAISIENGDYSKLYEFNFGLQDDFINSILYIIQVEAMIDADKTLKLEYISHVLENTKKTKNTFLRNLLTSQIHDYQLTTDFIVANIDIIKDIYMCNSIADKVLLESIFLTWNQSLIKLVIDRKINIEFELLKEYVLHYEDINTFKQYFQQLACLITPTDSLLSDIFDLISDSSFPPFMRDNHYISLIMQKLIELYPNRFIDLIQKSERVITNKVYATNIKIETLSFIGDIIPDFSVINHNIMEQLCIVKYSPTNEKIKQFNYPINSSFQVLYTSIMKDLPHVICSDFCVQYLREGKIITKLYYVNEIRSSYKESIELKYILNEPDVLFIYPNPTYPVKECDYEITLNDNEYSLHTVVCNNDKKPIVHHYFFYRRKGNSFIVQGRVVNCIAEEHYPRALLYIKKSAEINRIKQWHSVPIKEEINPKEASCSRILKHIVLPHSSKYYAHVAQLFIKFLNTEIIHEYIEDQDFSAYLFNDVKYLFDNEIVFNYAMDEIISLIKIHPDHYIVYEKFIELIETPIYQSYILELTMNLELEFTKYFNMLKLVEQDHPVGFKQFVLFTFSRPDAIKLDSISPLISSILFSANEEKYMKFIPDDDPTIYDNLAASNPKQFLALIEKKFDQKLLLRNCSKVINCPGYSNLFLRSLPLDFMKEDLSWIKTHLINNDPTIWQHTLCLILMLWNNANVPDPRLFEAMEDVIDDVWKNSYEEEEIDDKLNLYFRYIDWSRSKYDFVIHLIRLMLINPMENLKNQITLEYIKNIGELPDDIILQIYNLKDIICPIFNTLEERTIVKSRILLLLFSSPNCMNIVDIKALYNDLISSSPRIAQTIFLNLTMKIQKDNFDSYVPLLVGMSSIDPYHAINLMTTLFERNFIKKTTFIYNNFNILIQFALNYNLLSRYFMMKCGFDDTVQVLLNLSISSLEIILDKNWPAVCNYDVSMYHNSEFAKLVIQFANLCLKINSVHITFYTFIFKFLTLYSYISTNMLNECINFVMSVQDNIFLRNTLIMNNEIRWAYSMFVSEVFREQLSQKSYSTSLAQNLFNNNFSFYLNLPNIETNAIEPFIKLAIAILNSKSRIELTPTNSMFGIIKLANENSPYITSFFISLLNKNPELWNDEQNYYILYKLISPLDKNLKYELDVILAISEHNVEKIKELSEQILELIENHMEHAPNDQSYILNKFLDQILVIIS